MKSDPPSLVRHAAGVLAADARRAEPLQDDVVEAAVAATAKAIRARVAARRRAQWAIAVGAAAAVVAGVVATAALSAQRGRSREAVLAASTGAGAAASTGPSTSAAARPAANANASASANGAPAGEAGRATLAGVEGGVLAVDGAVTSRAANGAAAHAGERFVALQDGHATLLLATGTRITLEAGGDLAWLEQGTSHVFGVAAGAVRADVVKLGPDERFVLRTDDAEVEVRGTAFRVARAPSDPSCGAGTTTRVEVFDGVVTVRAHGAETQVPAGSSWPSGCARAGAAAARASTPSTPSTPGTPSGSALAAQNDLFDAAIAAEHRGDAPGAVALLDRFLARYPNAPLAENAAAERMAILAKTDRERASDAARAYTQRYPNGFARKEAQELLDGSLR